jgi:hypothetical protein
MKKIAPEIEELMWAIAESRDPQAIDEFGQRFPDLRGELGKRLMLTADLKGALKTPLVNSIPKFQPRAHHAVPVWQRPLALAAATLLLAMVAFGSYVAARRALESEAQPDSAAIVASRSGVSKDVQPDDPRAPKLLPGTAPDDPAVRVPPAQPAASLPEYLKPRTLSIKEGRFADVLMLVGAACNLEIEMPDVPPDMADMIIEANYENVSGLAILQDMGAKYGFTPFTQGGNRILIVPARPNGVEANTSSGGDH